MNNLENCTSNRKNERTGTTRLALALAFSLYAFAVCGVSYGAKPPQALNAAVCNGLGGQWTTPPNICTIPNGTSGVLSSSIRINGAALDIRGSLTISAGATVTVTNSGTITVENTSGLAPGMFHDWETGILVFGALDNAGTITVANVYDETNATPQGTEGITVSFSLTGDPSAPSTWVFVPGTFNNSGTITVQNTANTRGIKNLGTFVNATSGAIIVANSGTSSIGIYNRREKLTQYDNQYYTPGTLTNDGSITIQSSGDSANNTQYGYGIYSVSVFTNSATGTFTINPSPADDDAGGFYNKGAFTNFGTLINDRGNIDFVDLTKSTWGSFNDVVGTMVNYGTTRVATISPGTGTFYNNALMINLGEITSHGFLVDESPNVTMINFGAIYNFGGIGGGVNKGVCIDEPATDTTPAGGGCG